MQLGLQASRAVRGAADAIPLRRRGFSRARKTVPSPDRSRHSRPCALQPDRLGAVADAWRTSSHRGAHRGRRRLALAGDRRRRQQQQTQACVELARSAELAGAQAFLCTAPYVWSRPRLADAHFQAIHDAVGIPIILHDGPTRIARPLADATIERLAELPRIVGLKDATGDIERMARLRWRLADRLLLLSGDDATQAVHRLAGGDGCISVTANVTPALSAALHEACDRRETAAVARLEGILAPLHRRWFSRLSDPGQARAASPRIDGRRASTAADAARRHGRHETCQSAAGGPAERRRRQRCGSIPVARPSGRGPPRRKR